MKAIAPGKIILSGEHAVVYGRPAIAMAIDRSAQAVVTPQLAAEIAFDLPDLPSRESFTLRALRELKHRVGKNYRMFLEGNLGIRDVLRKPVELFEFAFITILDGLHLKVKDGLDIRMHSTIPIGCGMGSSAATILSVLRAMGHYFRVEFRPDWYYEYSMLAENVQHGHASGLDSYISIHGGCARFQDGNAERLPLPRMPMMLVNTGVPQCSTGECVERVRRHFAASRIWDEFGDVTLRMEQALKTNDVEGFRDLLRQNQRLLSRIGVVPDRVQQFIDEVEQRGGAAKVCGAGAVVGDAGGMVLVSADEPMGPLCDRFGFDLLSVRGEPLGVRIV